MLPQAALGQAELIVRLDDGAPLALTSSLESGASKNAAYVALFEAVTDVRPVLRLDGRPGSDRRPSPLASAYVLSVRDSAALGALRARWAAQADVRYVQPNHRYRLDGMRAAPPEDYNDPLLDSLSHLHVIRAYEGWDVTTGRADVRIGFVDTGLYFEHPDLQGQVWINPGEDLNGNGRADPSDFNGRDDDGNGYADDLRGYDFVDRPAYVEEGDYFERDADPSEDLRRGGGRGHGTIVAGALGAALDNGEGIAGVAPGARLVPLRAFGADGTGEDDDVAAAIVYAAETGLDVLNLSFGDVYYSPLMQEAIRYAVAQGTVVVASAGNLGGDDPHYPSDYPEVISVAWLNADGTGIAGRGTYGIGLDLGAPGSFIYTTTPPPLEGASGDSLPPPDANPLYGRQSGSSLAAPLVAGAAALLRSLDATLTPEDVRAVLAASADDIGGAGWDHRTGGGRLNVAAALRQALPARAEIASPLHNAGTAADVLPIVGTAAHPSFASYQLFYEVGDEDLDDDWTPITEPIARQAWQDTLARWDVGALDEDVYTLRLAVQLRTGETVEDRRRVYVDRSAPALDVRLLDDGLVDGRRGLLADVATDDFTRLEMEVTRGGRTSVVASDRRARRHGLTWADESGAGGTADVRLVATNAAGLETVYETTLTLPASALNTALFEEKTLAVPHGFLLPGLTDFDGDGLKEIVFNRYEEGWIGDTLAFYEWDGAGFQKAAGLLANVIPRDAGDANGDGVPELLTQVAGATLLLTPPERGAYPTLTAFLDTTGLSNPFDPDAAFGARLTDLDGDGTVEILAHNTKEWRLLEFMDGTFEEVARLENPTSVAPSEIGQNEFQEPEALVGDFDGDGRPDLLVGDADGDWIVYEATGGDALRVAWTYETGRYFAGSRFAGGDFDGDGRPEFVTYTQGWNGTTGDDEQEPRIGLLYFWQSTGDDAYAVVDSLPLAGAPPRHGAMAAADFDGDGRDELAIVHPPGLYVLGFDGDGRPTPRFYRGAVQDDEASGMRSAAVVAEDVDGDGGPDLVAAAADGRMHLFTYQSGAAIAPPPQWETALAVDVARVELRWRAPGADSVTVYRGDPEGALDVRATTTSATFADTATSVQRYALAAWYGGVRSPLSPTRTVRPEAPALVVDVRYPAKATVELVFSRPLHEATQAAPFRLDAGGRPAAVLLGQGGRSVILRFETVPAQADVLRWTDVRDRRGAPVGQTSVAVQFPAMPDATLILASWTILDAKTLELVFSEPLDPALATDVGNYRLQPSGLVERVAFDPEQPTRVQVTVSGRVLGPTGLATALVVERMRSASGNGLASAGQAVSLTEAAAGLADVYVFPNPCRTSVHAERVMVAGLPPEATVRILSAGGTPVTTLEERDGDGGLAWDLRDESGRPVPSGIYLVRVEAPGERAVLHKAAVIR